MNPLLLNGLGLVMSIIGILSSVIILGAGAYAIFTTTRKDQTEKRLRAWNEDLLRRLDYVEPQLQKAEAKNTLLMELHNPTAKLETMDTNQRVQHEETVRLLGEQRDILEKIEGTLKGGEKG